MKKNIFIKSKYILLCICFPIISHAQLFSKKYDIKTVQVAMGDSLCLADVMYHIKKQKKQTCTSCMYTWFSYGKIVKNQGFYDDMPLHGTYIIRNKDKHVLVSGDFEYGLKNGKWMHWDTQGNLTYTQEWENGKKSGEYITYKNNKAVESKEYENDTLNGKHSVYLDNNQTIVTYYKKGVWYKTDTLGLVKEKKECPLLKKKEKQKHQDVKRAESEEKQPFLKKCTQACSSFWKKCKALLKLKETKEKN